MPPWVYRFPSIPRILPQTITFGAIWTWPSGVDTPEGIVIIAGGNTVVSRGAKRQIYLTFCNAAIRGQPQPQTWSYIVEELQGWNEWEGAVFRTLLDE